LRKKITSASLHIYGAYSTQKVIQLHNEKEKFYVHGRAEDAQEALSKHKVLIAPIRFGAGVKGKFIDAMKVGTPSITTSIGAEGMKSDLDWNGAIEDEEDAFINQAEQLYQDKHFWLQSQHNGIRIINELYSKLQFYSYFTDKLKAIQLNLAAHRQNNFFGQILNYHTANSTKYMSLWIEEKNKATN
jgi:glycosyltransferase involved in cell wall biosynthesis